MAPFNAERFREAKAAAGDALLLIRVGDFYELFADDARDAAKILGITLTTRGKGTPNELPMAGFPYHQLDAYLAKLLRHDRRAAILDAMPA